MALKFQYNKNALQDLKKQLSIRVRALPILKSKETALRHEVRVLQRTLRSLEHELEEMETTQQKFARFWAEFPDVLFMNEPNIVLKNVVGVKVPHLENVSFTIRETSWFEQPAWLPAGIEALQGVISLQVKIEIAREQLETLHAARKKTTQKVNLYEKVQIPAYEDAIIKIKRFLEDKDNIAKSAQKIVKKRNEVKLVPA